MSIIKSNLTESVLKTSLITSLLTFGVVQNAMAASTMVTDAVGTQELWTFQEILGAQKLTSKINKVDSKGITQTWDTNGNKLSRTDAEGRVTTYTYNSTNQKTSMTEASGTAQARTTTYEYVNADIDLITKTISPSIFSSNSKEVVNAYDANQNVTSVTINGFDTVGGAVSRVTTFTHDAYGKVTSIDGPRTDVNDVTTLEYFDCNTGAECGQLKKVTNAAGHVSNYGPYDAVARLEQSTDSNGVVTSYTYHPRGWVLSMTQTPPTGDVRVTSYGYDNVGQLTKTTFPDGSEQNYVYDAAHYLREISDNLGNKVTYTYDAKGNRTDELVFDPDGTLVRSTITAYDIRNFIESINNGGSVTQLINDAVGNLSTQTDPNVNPSTSSSFDALDRMTNTVDALTNNSGYDYNVADQLTQVTAPNGAVTQYEYDDLGNQTKEISADRGTITYAHDDAGNVLSMTDARGVVTNYTYDVLNRITNVTFPNVSENITYTYDSGCANPVGRLCEVQDDSGSERYDYDAWGNVTRSEKDERDSLGMLIGSYVTSYRYDSANRVSQTTYPSGRTVSAIRDAIGRLVSLSSISSYGKNTNIITNRVYRADGFWVEQSYANDLIQTKDYDQQGRLTNHIAGDYIRQYSYDANGNIVGVDSQDNSVDRDFTYDVLDRLTQDNDPVRAMIRDFGYDANGNREQSEFNSAVTTLNYTPVSNRLASVEGSPLSLDASGRTLTDHVGRTYTYNDAGRVKTINMTGTMVGEYTYNAQQLRTQKNAGSMLTVYHYDLAGNMIAESQPASGSVQEYVYADGERVATFEGVMAPTASNLALGKLSAQSSTSSGGVASHAVDGNTNGAWALGSVTHTLSNAQAWWQVDLGAQAVIDTIQIHNRSEASSRLSDFYVLVSDTPFGSRTLSQLVADPSVDAHFHAGTLAGPSVDVPFSGIDGRYVRIQLQGTNYLSLAEVGVIGVPTTGATNLALGKLSAQSSTSSGGVSSRAVDGSTNGAWAQGSVTHTLNDSQAWWQVDLGVLAAIDTVQIHNRSEAPMRLSDFYVLVSDTPFGSRTLSQLVADSSVDAYFHAGTLADPSVDVPFSGIDGRYVRIQLQGTNYLSLAEVGVIGVPIAGASNMALGKLSAQSSTSSVGVSSRAVDGNTDGAWAQGSVTHTLNDSQAWWQVDLAAQSGISRVRVHNRVEAATRLSNFYVLISDTPFGSRTLTQLLADSSVDSHFHAGTPSGQVADVPFNNVDGRYVRIQLQGSNYLSLAEVEVISAPPGPTDSDGVNYYVNDHLSTPQKILDYANSAVWEATYDAFGKVDISTELVVNNHRFPGQYFDSETGLYYNWNRYYDSELGRYVTSDPIGLDGGLNTYGYVLGNPLRYSDPKGTLNPAQSVYEGCVLGILVGLGYLTSKTIEAVCGDDGSDCSFSSSNNNSDGDERPPYQGPPGGRINSDDGDGKPKQDRIYGDDGYPEKDIDYDHDHGSGSPHVHDWNGPGGRGPARPPEPGEAR